MNSQSKDALMDFVVAVNEVAQNCVHLTGVGVLANLAKKSNALAAALDHDETIKETGTTE